MEITSYLICFHRGNGNLPLLLENWIIIVTPYFFHTTYMIMKNNYPGELVNIYI